MKMREDGRFCQPGDQRPVRNIEIVIHPVRIDIMPESTNSPARSQAAAAALFLALLLVSTPAWGQVDSTLSRIQSLQVESADGELALFFSNGHRKRAEDLGVLLAAADRFLRDSLDVVVEISLAVLSEDDWQQVWPGPYGVPYLSLGRPWVAVMPAEVDNSVMFYGMSQGLGEQGARTMIDNIGFHEVGHAYISEYLYPEAGPNEPPLRWLDEFFAQYLAYAFMSELAADRAAVWDEFTQGTLNQFTPKYRSLDEFDAEYYGYLRSEEGTTNYAWYQSLFAQRAEAVYKNRGIGFLRELKQVLPWDQFDQWTTDEILDAMELVEPGFQHWATAVRR